PRRQRHQARQANLLRPHDYLVRRPRPRLVLLGIRPRHADHRSAGRAADLLAGRLVAQLPPLAALTPHPDGHDDEPRRSNREKGFFRTRQNPPLSTPLQGPTYPMAWNSVTTR